MVFKASRVTTRVINLNAERSKDERTTSWPVRAYYSALNRAVTSKHAYVDKMLAVFEFFLPQMFMHDNNRGQYYTMLASMPLPGRIFEAKYEEIGDNQPGWDH